MCLKLLCAFLPPSLSPSLHMTGHKWVSWVILVRVRSKSSRCVWYMLDVQQIKQWFGCHQCLDQLVRFSLSGTCFWFWSSNWLVHVGCWSDWSDWPGASIILLASLGSYLLLSPYKVELWNRSESALLTLALETWRRKSMVLEGRCSFLLDVQRW